MRVWLVCAILCLITVAGRAQPDSLWSRTYGGENSEECHAVQQTQDGGFILAGYTYSFGAGEADFWLVKTNPAGDSLWSRTYGGSESDHCTVVQQTADGGYMLAGTTRSYGGGDPDILLLKTNAQGDSLWARRFGTLAEEYCPSAQQTTDGGYILLGSYYVQSSSECAIWLIKTNADGDTVWTRLFSRADFWSPRYSAYAMRQTSDGGYILAGHYEDYENSVFGFSLIKVSANGDSLWSQIYAGTSMDQAMAVLQTADGGFLLGGVTQNPVNNHNDMLLLRTDAEGALLWRHLYGGIQEEWCWALERGAHDDYVAAGSTSSYGGGSINFWIIDISENGDSLWSRYFGTRGYEQCYSVARTREGDFVLAGFAIPWNSSNEDMWLVRTSEESAISPQAASPAACTLYPCYPNPFNSSTRISYELPRAGYLTLNLYDLTGRYVCTLSRGVSSAGYHSLLFDGSGLASGTYFLRLTTPDVNVTQRMTVLK